MLVYPATCSGELLNACFPAKPETDTPVFAWHRSGRLYYRY
ncbi:MAG: hypothetical protein ACLQNE_22800 [Thermoguttaceae bacterium]